MAFKIAYNAGHIYSTPGKRLPKELDTKETREWTLNDRVARYFATEMGNYDGVELRRMDDPNGVKSIDIDERVANANAWGADFYLSIHHNAAGVVFSGGGAEVYIDATGGASEKYARAIYNGIIAATGLKGNRSDPLRSTSDGVSLYECRATKMPAVLVECGFMDSKVDAPIILTDSFAKKTGVAIAQAIAAQAGLKKKVVASNTTAIDTLVKKGVINTAAYWTATQDALNYLPVLLENLAAAVGTKDVVSVKTAEEAINRLVTYKVISSPDYWLANYDKVKYLDALLIKAANRIGDAPFVSYKVRVTTDALNIRKGAGTNYAIVDVIRDKGVYTIVEEENGFGLLKSGAGWISLEYTKKV